MILQGPAPGTPTGLWLLESVSCAGKSTWLHRWRRETAAPVLWAAEDLATQRLFEPLETAHRPEAVEPWLRSLLAGWRELQARAGAMAWGDRRHGFLALQERFHMSAALEGGLGSGAFEALEAELVSLGAQGLLLTVSAETLARRLEASLAERPPAWGHWLARRHGGVTEAAADLLEVQERLRELAGRSSLPWIEART